MRIAIAGSSGLIGTELVTSLRSDGHEVIRLVRRTPKAASEVMWNPNTGEIDVIHLAGVDAFINLAGAGVGDHRWTKRYKKQIFNSRVNATRTIAQAASTVGAKTLINASAIGWYGETGTRTVDETSPAGTGFLCDVVVAWEHAAEVARLAGIRVVHARTGLVVSKHGGAWARITPLFKLGLGGRLGDGKQYWSFISMRDEISALKFLLTNSQLSGPVNLTAPYPATNAEVTATMSTVLRRPAIFNVPAIALRVVLGGFAQEVLGSCRVVPEVLDRHGFLFQDPDITSAMQTLIAK
ncbi:MAG: TIGR01777 family oxidoreductase [Actinomycetes bacterium]